MTDAKRLDYLESLLKRTEYQNKRVPACPVRSDMHFSDGRCTLYIRNMFANVIQSGSGISVRDAIDMAIGE